MCNLGEINNRSYGCLDLGYLDYGFLFDLSYLDCCGVDVDCYMSLNGWSVGLVVCLDQESIALKNIC
jgi:hypothetical protein